MKKQLFTVLLAGALLGATTASVLAQAYPNKPIRIIVPFSPGGGNDVLGRVIGQKLQERLGQPGLVENKVGAGGNIGTEFVARSAPDGYTLLVVTNAMAAFVPSLFSAPLPFDIMNDFAPIGFAMTGPVVVAVGNNVPVKSINELIAYAKANPGKLSYGSPGVGTMQHLVTAWFVDMTGTKMVHVPYKGSAGTVADLLSGELQVLFGALNALVPSIQGGKIRAIAVTERERLQLQSLKDVPTVRESLPGYEATMWYGLVAPAGTPAAITNKLSDEQRAIVNLPEVRERLAGIGLYSNPTSAAEMRQIMATEIGKWGKVVKAAGIQPL
ncbi:MAG: tripartite tricarboxylate transporter substrate binding protein [Betaproteobacteria bacterium]|nr:tripartite tricarboxylate transporter substrate binding protein [Betaproteobacteria bacterium]